MKKNIFFIILIFLFPACSKKLQHKTDSKRLELTSKLLYLDNADLFDIPIPNNVNLNDLTLPNEKTNHIFEYKSSDSTTDLIAYYRTEMDYLGWQLTDMCIGKSSCLHFVKPSKFCTVTIRSAYGSNNVTLFIGSRRKKN